MRFLDPPEQFYKRKPRGFGALRRSRPWSEQDRREQEARAAEATAIREREEAEWEAASRAAGATPGSVAELRLSDKQAYFAWWRERNAKLVDEVRQGDVVCCGEHQRPGYRHWCSLLGRPTYFVDGERVNEEIVHFRRCEGCPVAVAIAERTESAEAWISSFLSFLKGIEDGNGIGASAGS